MKFSKLIFSKYKHFPISFFQNPKLKTQDSNLNQRPFAQTLSLAQKLLPAACPCRLQFTPEAASGTSAGCRSCPGLLQSFGEKQPAQETRKTATALPQKRESYRRAKKRFTCGTRKKFTDALRCAQKAG
ncbi:MAG: hypothetical protein WC792_06455 [Candidatus Micrarchaeia archaeon]|jgi:hypothetical protein